MSRFVHLHLHSQYSLLDGANRIDRVIDAAVEQGAPAVALTDHGNLFGAIEFYNRARAAGINPIVGIEAYTTRGDMTDRTAATRGGGSNHLVLLAKDETGYRNLIKLSSRAFLEGFYYKPRMDKALLRRHSEGIIALSACLKGEVAEKITAGRERDAEASATELLEIFGEGNFFLELQDHGIEEQRLANEALRRISRRTGIPLVVTNDCHYLGADDAFAHDVLLCIGTQRNLADPDRLRYASDQFYLKTADEMFALFPHDAQAIENTLAIAERCKLEIPTGTFHLPEFPVPAGETLDSYFERAARDGLERRFEEMKKRSSPTLAKLGETVYRERLEREIGIVETMGFPGYFLVVWDFIRHAREQDIPVGPGRGSAAGSLVSYALRITDIDPLKYGLLFERFLNPERISMPDIDIDFCMRRRGEVIDYVNAKYGRDKVAQIITFGTLGAKAVIRDVGRVMGLPYGQVDRIAKLVPDMTRSLAENFKENDALQAEANADPEVARVIEVGQKLEGLTRHASVHAAGVVIAPRPIEELVPLYKSSKDEVTTQWDMTVVEGLGLLKMDFLGLRTLTVIDDAVRMVRRRGVDLDLDAVPLDDPAVFDLFCDGRTNGIFQFESRGMKDLLRRARPSRFEDLAAFNALYRPGALSVGMVEEYIQRKLGRKFAYALPELKPILEETYGVVVYQEQVMQIAVAVAGFSLGEADVLRKAMGKKKLEVMEQQKEKFISGAVERGVPANKAKQLWDYIEPFAGYGFNKSHSVAYAMLAYKTAYLKAHYPVAFMAAMLNSELSSSDSIAKYVRECRKMGIEVLPPDINESDWWFTAADGKIRFGLGGVKGLGEGAVEEILTARRLVGRFGGLIAVATEIDGRQVNHKVFEMLVKAGCFDSLGLRRKPLFDALEEALSYGQSQRRQREEGQKMMFAAGAMDEAPKDPTGSEWPEGERLRCEKEALGFYLTGNPLSEHEAELERLVTHTVADLKEDFDGAVTLGGLVTKVRPTKIKSGRNAGRLMGRFVLEDLTGTLPCILFADHFDRFGSLLEDEAVVIVKGFVRERGSDTEMNVDDLVPLKRATRRLLEKVQLSLDAALSAGQLLKLRDLLAEHAGPVPLELRIALPDRVVSILPEASFKVRFDPGFIEAVETMLGEGALTEHYAG